MSSEKTLTNYRSGTESVIPSSNERGDVKELKLADAEAIVDDENIQLKNGSNAGNRTVTYKSGTVPLLFMIHNNFFFCLN